MSAFADEDGVNHRCPLWNRLVLDRGWPLSAIPFYLLASVWLQRAQEPYWHLPSMPLGRRALIACHTCASRLRPLSHRLPSPTYSKHREVPLLSRMYPTNDEGGFTLCLAEMRFAILFSAVKVDPMTLVETGNAPSLLGCCGCRVFGK